MAAEGPRAFYEGALADSIAADLRSGGSRITTDDLAAYAVEEPEPLTGRHRGAELHTAGAVSGGQRLLDMLAYVERNPAPRNAVGADTWTAYARGLDDARTTPNGKAGLGEKGGERKGVTTSEYAAHSRRKECGSAE